MWEANAKYCAEVFGVYVDWDERFYECPECGEPIYECDWKSAELEKELCPICGFDKDDSLFLMVKNSISCEVINNVQN